MMMKRARFSWIGLLAGMLLLWPLGAQSENETSPNGMSQEQLDECLKQVQILQENVKMKDYQYALPALKPLLDECYTTNTGIYIYGEMMLFALLADSAYEARHDGLLDTLFLLYDRRVEAAKADPKFGTEGFILGRKLKALAKFRTREFDEVHALAERAVTLSGDETDAQVMFLYMQYTAVLNKLKKMDCDDVIAVYNQLSDYIEINLEKYEGVDTLQYNNYTLASEKVDQLAGPCLTCDNLLQIFGRDFEQKKDDENWIKKAAAALDKRRCAKLEAYRDNPLIFAIIERNVEVNPSAKGWVLVGRQYALKNDCARSIDAFQKAVELEENIQAKTTYMKYLAGRYMECGDYSNARSVARKMLEIRPNWGWPYIFIGDLYANSVNRCKTETSNKCTMYAVYWAAADKYAQARSVDSEFAQQANSRLARMAGVFPLKSDCFMNDLMEGASFTVGCWINETTTVKVR